MFLLVFESIIVQHLTISDDEFILIILAIIFCFIPVHWKDSIWYICTKRAQFIHSIYAIQRFYRAVKWLNGLKSIPTFFLKIVISV